MGAVNIGVDGGKFIFEGVADKALSGQMVTLIGDNLFYHIEDTGVALHGPGMQGNAIQKVSNPPQAMEGVFQGNTPHEAMDFISFGKQQLRQVTSILAGYAGNKGPHQYILPYKLFI